MVQGMLAECLATDGDIHTLGEEWEQSGSSYWCLVLNLHSVDNMCTEAFVLISLP